MSDESEHTQSKINVFLPCTNWQVWDASYLKHVVSVLQNIYVLQHIYVLSLLVFK